MRVKLAEPGIEYRTSVDLNDNDWTAYIPDERKENARTAIVLLLSITSAQLNCRYSGAVFRRACFFVFKISARRSTASQQQTQAAPQLSLVTHTDKARRGPEIEFANLPLAAAQKVDLAQPCIAPVFIRRLSARQ